MSVAGSCFGCGGPIPLRFFCTCGKRECMKDMGKASRDLEIREWLIYEAGLRRAQELAKEHVYAWGEEVDAEQGLCSDIGVSFTAFDQAIDAEVAKEGK